MSDTQALQVGYGKAVFKDASASLAVFAVAPPFIRHFPSKKYEQRGRPQVFGTTKYPDISGNLMLASLVVPDGELLCLQLSQKANGLPVRDGAVWLRTRREAAAITVAGNIPVNHESLVGSHYLMFQGRADILSLEELESAGIEPLIAWVDGYMNEEEVEECFVVTELAPETSAKPRSEVVLSLSGEKIEIRGSTAKRRIRMGKNAGS